MQNELLTQEIDSRRSVADTCTPFDQLPTANGAAAVVLGREVLDDAGGAPLPALEPAPPPPHAASAREHKASEVAIMIDCRWTLAVVTVPRPLGVLPEDSTAESG